MPHSYLPSLGICAAVISSYSPASAEVALSASSIIYSENFNLNAILDDFKGGDFNAPGERSLAHSQLDLSYRRNGYSFAMFTRFDGYFDYTPDAASFFWNTQNDLPFDDKIYDLDLKGQTWASKGLTFGLEKKPIPALTLGTKVSVFETSYLYSGTAHGFLITEKDQPPQGQFNFDYNYRSDIFFNREVEAPSGKGFSLDADIAFQANDRLKLSISAKDLWSKTQWNDSPHTNLDLTSDRISQNADGTLTVRPALSGKHSTNKLTTRYKTQINMTADYRLSSKWNTQQSVLKFGHELFATSKLSYAINEKFSVSGVHEWNSGAFGLELENRNFIMGLASNALSSQNASYLSAHIGFRIALG